MSNKKTNNPLSGVMIHGFYVERFNNFLGRILTQIEVLGLPEGQEKSFKDVIKNEIWDLWEHAPFIEEKELENPISSR